MSILNSIENWFARFRPYLFVYKKGFFELQYLANSPQAMIGAFNKIPFIKFDKEKQSIAANTLFVNVHLYYREIEEELFMLCSETKFKANVSFKHYYDKSIPADYFCLSLCQDHHAKALNSILNDAGFPDNSWLLLKPAANVSHHHFKGTTGRYISVYFTNRWLENYLQHSNNQARKEWTAFLDSGSDHLICPHLPGNTLFDEQNLFKLFFSPDEFRSEDYKAILQSEALKLFSFFSSKLKSENISERHFLVSNRERILVLSVEQLLKEQLYEKFPGIDVISASVGASETRLKECFKTVHNTTLFQYFRDLQMEKAKELMLDPDLMIVQIADKLGYENASKFSAAFKKFHGSLPSEIRKAI